MGKDKIIETAMDNIKSNWNLEPIPWIVREELEKALQSQCQKCSISEHPENPRFSENQKIIEEIKKFKPKGTFIGLQYKEKDIFTFKEVDKLIIDIRNNFLKEFATLRKFFFHCLPAFQIR